VQWRAGGNIDMRFFRRDPPVAAGGA
jgi:hypothetical protein